MLSCGCFPPMILWLGGPATAARRGNVTLLLTLVTNKMYLGLAANPWDPIVFGVVIAGAAIVLRRWIAAGPGEARNGFTAARVSAMGDDVVAAVGTASAAFHPGTVGKPETHQQPEFDGGRSGGAGGGADF